MRRSSPALPARISNRRPSASERPPSSAPTLTPGACDIRQSTVVGRQSPVLSTVLGQQASVLSTVLGQQAPIPSTVPGEPVPVQSRVLGRQASICGLSTADRRLSTVSRFRLDQGQLAVATVQHADSRTLRIVENDQIVPAR